MKIRNGFVSNSSSSSFIFAIAEITDKASLITRFDSFSPDILSFITTKAKLLEQYMYSDNKIYKDLSTGSYEFDLNQLEDDKTYLLLDETGPEGDGYFCDNHYGDMNYDIDLSDYDPYQRKLYIAITSNEAGLNHIDAHYQAGRDG